MYFETKNIVPTNNYTYEHSSLEKSTKVDEIAPSTSDTKNNSSHGNQEFLNPTTVRALEAAGLPANEKNIELVETMMREGLKIDKDSIQSMYRTLLKYPQLDCLLLTSMKALDIEISDATMRQFECYSNQKHHITEGLQTVGDAMWQVSLELFEKGDSQNMQSSLSLLGELVQGGDMPEETVKFVKMAKELVVIMDSLPEQNQSLQQGTVRNPGNITNIPMSAEVNGGSDLVGNSLNNPIYENLPLEQGEVLQNNNLLFMEKVQELIKNFIPVEDQNALEQKLAEINSNKGLIREIQKLECILLGIQNADELRVENQNARSHDILLLNALGKNQENQVHIPTKNLENPELFAGNNVEKLVADIKGFFDVNDSTVNKEIPYNHVDMNKLGVLQEQIKDFVKQVLFENKELMWQVKDKFSQSILLNPEDVANPVKIRELYDNLNLKLGQMTKILVDAGISHSQTTYPLVQMQENIQFMNQLNQVFQYVQIPLRMYEKDVCGELCVYTNKKHLAQEDGNLSAFLHLDMEYMGPVDVYVNLQKGNYVSTNFYLQDDETLDFISQHIHLLDERLTQKGYKVSTNIDVRQQEEQKSVVNQMLNYKSMDVKAKLLSVNSFDTLI